MCTPDYIHPSPQDLRGLKLSRFRNFRYFKKITKPIYIDIDLQRQLLDPTSHPRRAVPHFQNIPLFFALPPAIQFLLPSTSFFNTCGTVKGLKVVTSHCSVAGPQEVERCRAERACSRAAFFGVRNK